MDTPPTASTTIRAEISDVPHFSKGRERFIRMFGIFSLIVGLCWLYWRWNYTLNPDAMWFSLLLVSAETWGLFISAMFLFNAWRIPEREHLPPAQGRSVDVFITAYDEPLEVLRRTALGAKAIRYPHRTYVLDDGKRDEVRALTEELGIGYIRRVGSINAKAGNLNHAISVTRGEFILQLDTDHVPLPNIVDELLGYFNDPLVALVQSPQDFYNTDSFTHVVNAGAKSLWEENRIFYSLIQPGKDYWNGSFFCGSCGMLRRSAIEAIGGFSTKTIIEDMETSIVLHTHGWKSRYHQEALAFGLSPSSASAFHVQRMRWAQGSMQILRKMNPLFLPGLQPGQRLTYLTANLYPFDGWQKLIFYLSPVVFLLTGLVPVKADTGVLMAALSVYLIVSIASFELTARGTGYILISERYNVAKFWTFAIATLTLFTNKKLKFNVTPKGISDIPLQTYLPHLLLLIVSAVALVWAPLAFHYGWVNYQVKSFDLAFIVSMVWLCWNIYYSAGVVRLSRGARQQRADHRFVDDVPVTLALDDGSVPSEWPAAVAMTENLNPSGMAFRATFELPAGTPLRCSLPLSSETVNVVGKVMHVAREHAAHGNVFVHGVLFEDVPVSVRDAIETHCTQHAVPVWRRRYRQSVDVVARAAEVLRNPRRNKRVRIQLPARLVIGEGATERISGGLLEELSPQGARLLVELAILPGTPIRFEVPGSEIDGSGRVVFSSALESPMNVRFTIGVALDAPIAFGHSRSRIGRPGVGSVA
ncbi:MAG: glycosyltransferase [Gemmatimonadota bacterium]